MGFEPTRAEPIGLAVQRLNHSATSSCQGKQVSSLNGTNNFYIKKKVKNISHAGS